MLDDIAENLDQTQEVPESQEPVQDQPVTSLRSAETEKERNIRIMADRAERAERRIAELENTLHQRSQQPQQQLQAQEDDDFAIDDDDVPVGRQIKKQFKTLKNKLETTQKQLEMLNQKTSVEQAELKLNAKYNDFNSIVTTDNIKALAEVDPDAYRSIMSLNDIYDRGYTAYQLISNKLRTMPQRNIDRKIEDNKIKPRSAATISAKASSSPLTQVTDYERRVLSEEDRDRIMKEHHQRINSY